MGDFFALAPAGGREDADANGCDDWSLLLSVSGCRASRSSVGFRRAAVATLST